MARGAEGAESGSGPPRVTSTLPAWVDRRSIVVSCTLRTHRFEWARLHSLSVPAVSNHRPYRDPEHLQQAVRRDSITSSARVSNEDGTERPRTLAV